MHLGRVVVLLWLVAPGPTGVPADHLIPGLRTPAPRHAPQAPTTQPEKPPPGAATPQPRTEPAKPADAAEGQVEAEGPPAAQPAAPLDLKMLEQQLRATKAIGFFTKISLKNKVDDLLDDFADYYDGDRKRTMTDLRRSYELLVMKVLSLLQDGDPPLARAIVASREAIWDMLADPQKFAALRA